MSLNIIVCAKQVMDPETPTSAFNVDEAAKRVVPAQGVPPVVNGFCENAVEAALKIKESEGEATITIISVGNDFVMDVMKKPLSMGADHMILIQDPATENLDALGTATVLAKAIEKIGGADIVICGQQASDWDNAHVPLGIGEMLGIACLSEARNIDVGEGSITVASSRPDGYEVFEAALPCLVTVNNEIGEPRYPTLRGIMQASKKTPETWTLGDLNLSESDVSPAMTLSELFIPVSDRQCEIIEGEDEADSGRLLALKLREEKII
ncbi:electron transfer flavoprotein subunit beta/FixA family protein [Chloroflexi bacterium]|nr:electron transfer flavoprotein subunit beta/FixA family protein [Chloroflexota bacterium]